MSETKSRFDWPAIRLAYEETDETVETIAARHGLHRITIQGRAAREGWKPRNPELAGRVRVARPDDRPPPDLRALVLSLQRTTARVVAAMETRFGRDGDGIDEKDVRALGTLAGALAKIIDLELPKRSPRDDTDPSLAERDDRARRGGDAFRNALADRLEALLGPAGEGGSDGRANADRSGGAADGLGHERPAGPASSGG